jgi:hypothetical protein
MQPVQQPTQQPMQQQSVQQESIQSEKIDNVLNERYEQQQHQAQQAKDAPNKEEIIDIESEIQDDDELPSRNFDSSVSKYATIDSIVEDNVDDELMNAIMNRGTGSSDKGDGTQKPPTINSTIQLKSNTGDIMAMAKEMEKGR